MTVLWLILGIVSIFVAGAVAAIAFKTREFKDMYMSALGLAWGVYLIIVVMGKGV